MRPRRITIYSQECLLEKDLQSAEPHYPVKTPLVNSQRRFNDEELCKLFEDFGPLDPCISKGDFSDEFHIETTDSCSTRSSSLCLASSQGLSRADSHHLFEDEDKSNKLLRAMVIGSRNSHKSSIISTVCPVAREGESINDDKKFDLITSHIESEKSIERYHFWLKEAQTEQKNLYSSILKVYYKTCSAFFLVYNIHDRASFDLLEQEIDTIKQENLNKEVLLVLVGNQFSLEDIQINAYEAMEFKKKHNVQFFIGSQASCDSVKDLKEAIKLQLK